MDPEFLTPAKEATIRVGKGRGFLISRDPLPHMVITAAHCLPHLPPAHPAAYTQERTYTKLLGSLGGEATLWAECLFVDPIADLAVLAAPDGQADLSAEQEAYQTFMESRPTLRVATLERACPVWLLMLNGEWERCMVEPGVSGRSITLIDAKDGHAPGTSGSPILTTDGYVVGVVSVGSEISGQVQASQPWQPALTKALPAWLLSELLDERGGR